MQAGIQADDLTGACDTGAPFAARGLATVVLLPDARRPASLPEVLVVDTESRGLAPEAARARARAAAARLASHRPGVLYKKVDSTLRGAVAAELVGALEGAGCGRTVLAPALPAQRRTVVDGLLRVASRPAGETAVARDSRFPATGASVLALLGPEGPHPATLVPLATVRRGPEAVRRRLDRCEASFVCDAETDTDLADLAAAVNGWPGLLAGSAGFVGALAARLPRVPGRPHGLRRPLLVVAGSAHPVTRLQVARLEARGVPVLTPPPADTGDRATIVQALADAARREIERGAPRTLLLTGGETAYSVCRTLGAAAIALGGELEPGVAFGVLLDGPFEGLAVITKAGGFGDADTLVHVLEACA
ncbi:MAG: four-carbon acid sugar kinase family protein [Candidatus Rokubacteria bacterium]|nr:four-carbon acid sugar kinase family protein [Candidatus Rokubacteria bacterium]